MSRPCVLFLDEFDAIAKMRDDEHELGELKRVVISLLQNIDAMGREHVLLAATNHEHLLDPAIWRRFSYKVKVGPPNDAARLEMAHLFLGSFCNPQLAETLAAFTAGLSGAQIRDIAEDSVREAVINNRKDIDVRDLISKTWSIVHPDTEAALEQQLAALRQINKKLFTQKRLAEIFGLSQSHVCELLRKAKKHAA
jgi:SpoVK/Ycf46/Vps4 family AAA+-type ATPase